MVFISINPLYIEVEFISYKDLINEYLHGKSYIMIYL